MYYYVAFRLQHAAVRALQPPQGRRLLAPLKCPPRELAQHGLAKGPRLWLRFNMPHCALEKTIPQCSFRLSVCVLWFYVCARGDECALLGREGHEPVWPCRRNLQVLRQVVRRSVCPVPCMPGSACWQTHHLRERTPCPCVGVVAQQQNPVGKPFVLLLWLGCSCGWPGCWQCKAGSCTCTHTIIAVIAAQPRMQEGVPFVGGLLPCLGCGCAAPYQVILSKHVSGTRALASSSMHVQDHRRNPMRGRFSCIAPLFSLYFCCAGLCAVGAGYGMAGIP